jgi:serine/threonine protein kinase
MSKLSSWEKKETLGKGSYGSVYHIVNKADGSHLAIKEINKQVDKDDEELEERIHEDFKNEVYILKRLKQVCKEYVLCYKDSYDDWKNYYIVTEFLENYMDLQHYIDTMPKLKQFKSSASASATASPIVVNAVAAAKEGKLKLIRTIICNLLAGIHQIHEQKVAHLDIKPKNILVNPYNGKIKYIDLGLSCYNTECYGDSQIGTDVYMAPEIYNSTSGKYLDLHDYQTADLWSLGATILELIEGRELGKDTNQYIMERSPEIIDLLTHLLKKNPRERHVPAYLASLCFPPTTSTTEGKEEEAQHAAKMEEEEYNDLFSQDVPHIGRII